jgi:phosphoadenosine phosphosulfate reductase
LKKLLHNEYERQSGFFQLFGQDYCVLIANSNAAIKIFTLDTGRLFQETHDVFKTLKKYKSHIEVYFPEATAVQNLLNAKVQIVL